MLPPAVHQRERRERTPPALLPDAWRCSIATYEPGRYVCVGGHGLGPTLIKIGTRSKYVHVAQIETSDGGIIEAMPGGVRRGHISDYAGLPAVCNLAEPMTSTQQAQIIAAAQAAIGTPYNDLAIVDDGLESLGLLWGWLANLASADHELICSQAVSMWGAAAGFDWSCGKKDLSEVTPANLARRPWMVPIDIKAAA